ncbi:MAG: bifunctional nuclease family protein [Deltaproteobacteria bacterium]|nr:bifunctional nuclease family protein [Deltaproteobacteria bacterium]
MSKRFVVKIAGTGLWICRRQSATVPARASIREDAGHMKSKSILFAITILFAIFSCPPEKRAQARPVVLPLRNQDVIQVKVKRVILDPVSKQPVVMLSDTKETRALPIWIDMFTASAIQSELKQVEHQRPLTHDLLERIIKDSGLKVKKVIITNLRDGIYYARITVDKEGSPIHIDARPSDSIVIALKFALPIFVSKELFTDKSIPLRDTESAEEAYGLRTQPLTPSLSEAFSFSSTHGLLVADVLPDSPAESDGLRRGDILVRIGELEVENKEALRKALEKSAGASIRAMIYRKGQFVTLELHPK